MRIVEAYKPSSVAEAHCICQMLEDAGIECQITGEDLATMYGISTGWNKAGILVSEDNLPRARELIAHQLAQSSPNHVEPKRTFQYGMRSILINVTLIAIILGFYLPMGPQWPDFAKLAFFYLFLGNVMAYAYVLKRRRSMVDESDTDCHS
jgi:hypothetical protein